MMTILNSPILLWPTVTIIVLVYGIQQYCEHQEKISENRNPKLLIILAAISGTIFVLLSAGVVAMYMLFAAPVYIKGGLIALGLGWPIISLCLITVTAYRYIYRDPYSGKPKGSMGMLILSIASLAAYYAVYGAIIFCFD